MKFFSGDLHIYRGKLPHWRATGVTYFVTWRIKPGVEILEPAERDLVATALTRFHDREYQLHAWVVMDDHIHILLTPNSGFLLEGLVRAWKSFTSRVLNKSRGTVGALWQREYFDRIVRNEEEFLERSRYILRNPWARWPDLNEYPWVGAMPE